MPPVASSSYLPSVGATPLGSATTAQPLTPRTFKASKARNVNLLTQHLRIGHQRVSIDVDLSKNKIEGLTDITVVPTTGHLKSIKLDCREMKINEILVNNRQANFIYKDMLYINDEAYFENCISANQINIYDIYNKNLSIHQHHILRQKLNYIFGEVNEDPRADYNEVNHGNTEELTILLPDNLKLELANLSSVNTPSSRPNTMSPMYMKSRNTHSEVYSPIQVKIEYEVKNPKNGVNFITEIDQLPTNMWHAYTTNSTYNISTSSWVPCIDNLWERNSWTMDVHIPRTVKDIGRPVIIGTKEAIESRKQEYKRQRRERRNQRRLSLSRRLAAGDADAEEEEGVEDDYDDEEDDEDEDEIPQNLTVSTGDYIETKEVPHPTDLSKKTVLWSIFNPVCAHHLAWGVGCFESIDLPEEANDSEDADIDDSLKEISCPVKIYCLPGQQELAKNTSIFTRKAINYFLKEFGSFPFNSYSVLFVHGCYHPMNNFAGLSIIDDSLLYPPSLIEPVFSTTETLVEAIASQWSGINITPQQFNDIWCIIGIARFMTFQFLKVLMGANELRFKMKSYINDTVRLDVGKKPIALTFFRFPVSESDLEFIRLKSPLVLSILDKRMTKTDKSFGLSRVLPKLFLQAMSGDLVNNTLTTQHFQYICEKVNRNRLESFFRQWVFGAGTPVFNVSQRFNRKRGMIEVVFRQTQAQESKRVPNNKDNFIENSIALLDEEPSFPVQSAFVGPITIRVHEADGTPYEHIVELKDGSVKVDINYNSKFRRMKKHKEDAAEGGTYSRFGDVLQSRKDLEKWNFTEWPPIDDEELYNNAFEWLRVDADFEWIAKINVRQPDYMYASQLQYDRDVEAQYEAIRFFGRQEKPILPYCTTLTRTLMDSRYYYGVRVAAARALGDFSKQSNNFIGLEYLIKAYKELFCFPGSTIPKANDFSNIPMFLLQREFPKIFASIRDDSGDVPHAIKDLLLNLVIYNENSNNKFQDSLYLSQLVESLTTSVINVNSTIKKSPLESHVKDEMNPKDREFMEAVIAEIDRQQKLDEFVPSYHYILSTTCIKQKVRLAIFGLMELPFEDLLALTVKNYTNDIRIEAFRGLLILGGLKNAGIMHYFLNSCLLEFNDLSFRSRLIAILVDSVCFAAVYGTGSGLDDPEFKTLEKYVDNSSSSAPNGTNLVVVEGDKSVDTRREQQARASLKGTIQLLRRDFSAGKGLRGVFWELLHSSLISIFDKRNLFCICQVLYKEIDSFIVDLPIPNVPLKELNKKIVLRNLGEGKVLFHREGRFKIQLATKIILNKPKTEKPRLKLKLGSGSGSPSVPPTPDTAVETSKPSKEKVKEKAKEKPTKEKVIKETVKEIPRNSLVTRPSTNVVTFKIARRKLQHFKIEKPAPAPVKRTVVPRNGVKVVGTTISIPIKAKPIRYVKISLKNKAVSVSRDPFEEDIVNIEQGVDEVDEVEEENEVEEVEPDLNGHKAHSPDHMTDTDEPAVKRVKFDSQNGHKSPDQIEQSEIDPELLQDDPSPDPEPSQEEPEEVTEPEPRKPKIKFKLNLK